MVKTHEDPFCIMVDAIVSEYGIAFHCNTVINMRIFLEIFSFSNALQTSCRRTATIFSVYRLFQP